MMVAACCRRQQAHVPGSDAPPRGPDCRASKNGLYGISCENCFPLSWGYRVRRLPGAADNMREEAMAARAIRDWQAGE